MHLVSREELYAENIYQECQLAFHFPWHSSANFSLFSWVLSLFVSLLLQRFFFFLLLYQTCFSETKLHAISNNYNQHFSHQPMSVLGVVGGGDGWWWEGDGWGWLVVNITI